MYTSIIYLIHERKHGDVHEEYSGQFHGCSKTFDICRFAVIDVEFCINERSENQPWHGFCADGGGGAGFGAEPQRGLERLHVVLVVN